MHSMAQGMAYTAWHASIYLAGRSLGPGGDGAVAEHEEHEEGGGVGDPGPPDRLLLAATAALLPLLHLLILGVNLRI
jgi:hypothetical protein